jgi:hypothetical protein
MKWTNKRSFEISVVCSLLAFAIFGLLAEQRRFRLPDGITCDFVSSRGLAGITQYRCSYTVQGTLALRRTIDISASGVVVSQFFEYFGTRDGECIKVFSIIISRRDGEFIRRYPGWAKVPTPICGQDLTKMQILFDEVSDWVRLTDENKKNQLDAVFTENVLHPLVFWPPDWIPMPESKPVVTEENMRIV